MPLKRDGAKAGSAIPNSPSRGRPAANIRDAARRHPIWRAALIHAGRHRPQLFLGSNAKIRQQRHCCRNGRWRQQCARARLCDRVICDFHNWRRLAGHNKLPCPWHARAALALKRGKVCAAPHHTTLAPSPAPTILRHYGAPMVSTSNVRNIVYAPLAFYI